MLDILSAKGLSNEIKNSVLPYSKQLPKNLYVKKNRSDWQWHCIIWVTKIIWGFSVNNWGLIWGLKVSLKFEKIKRDVELWLYRLQEIHLFFVVFSLFWFLNCQYPLFWAWLFFLLVRTSFLTFVCFDLFLWFGDPFYAGVLTCSPQDAVSCIIEIGESSWFSFEVFRFSIERLHGSIGKTCIIFFFARRTFSMDLYFCILLKI